MTEMWWTLPGMEAPPMGEGVSPGLRYLKWHPYDIRFKKQKQGPPRVDYFPADQKESTEPYLRRLAQEIDAVVAGEQYRDWFERQYLPALDALPSPAAGQETAPTAWRLVIGFATNPALETGLNLHHLYGFPYLPGSSVKGLVHHTAEMRVVEEELGSTFLPEVGEEGPAPPDETALERFLQRAETIWMLFGSLTVRRAENPVTNKPEGAWTPRAVLAQWGRVLDGRTAGEHPSLPRIHTLLEEHTAGLLCFYDAVPVPGQRVEKVVEADVLTPHYSKYYQGRPVDVDPSDDDDPIPVNFLAVAPGIQFTFPIRVRGKERGESAESGTEPAEPAAAPIDADEALSLAKGWLRAGLTLSGIGAKTTAGYGYFGSTRLPPPSSQAPSLEEIRHLPTRDKLRELELPAEERWARATLPEGLPPGTVAQTIDNLKAGLSPEEAGRLARRVVDLYPEAIDDWRSKALKKTAQKRLQWIEEHTSDEEEP